MESKTAEVPELLSVATTALRASVQDWVQPFGFGRRMSADADT
jgi:hypothetical protein